MNPRASMPTNASSDCPRHGAAIASIAAENAQASANTGVMSLNSMPGFGKSSTSRISRVQSFTSIHLHADWTPCRVDPPVAGCVAIRTRLRILSADPA